MPYDTMKQSGYTYIEYIGSYTHVLENENGERELWFANKNHASYGIIYKNSHLEFMSSNPAYEKQVTSLMNSRVR